MKLNDIPYKRPVFESYESEFKNKLNQLKESSSFQIFATHFEEIYKKRDQFFTNYELAYIRFTQDTSNDFYQKEVNYFDKISPKHEHLIHQFYETLLQCPYKKEIEQKWGKHILDLAASSLKKFSSDIIQDLQTENNLITQYTKIKGSAAIEYEGEKFNLAGMGKFLIDKSRTVRKKAFQAKWNFFSKQKNQLDDLFDQMVKLRHEMALKMGCENFVELGYRRVGSAGRLDYDKKMVSKFREQVVQEIVPITQKLREKQKQRLAYSKLEAYDLEYHYPSGNPKPKTNPEETLRLAKKMYEELSPETGTFFNYLLEHQLLDVFNRKGKADAGYCWSISNYKHPFIFANFNGTEGDIHVLTHEAGHAFQYFKSRDYNIIEYREPTSEAAEVHAMSMEFLTYPWMEYFFKEDTEKYFYSHITKSLLFIPYGCAIDHFQHIIYENPNYTPQQRADVWKEMEQLYLPDRNMEAHPYLQNGRWWQCILHIYEIPFYCIDYVLAQFCALQFWKKSMKDKTSTWNDYAMLCKAGGTKPFLQLIKNANITSPFDEGIIKNIASQTLQYLDEFDDSKF